MRQYEQAIFYTVWDKENNGVFLTSDSKNALKINPRPVQRYAACDKIKVGEMKIEERGVCRRCLN